ncbi:MAG: hypothetical protein JO316_15050 [Abitibacteriaceae bacterium]|nr:hypothetical protein [Abditibacteriaceae bacterium]MBV9866669.1 hypothetical protein [Abditibacteriaceae bacterium]
MNTLDDQDNELPTEAESGAAPSLAHDNSCGRFVAGMMAMVAATVTLIFAHASRIPLPWLALLPVGVGFLLLLCFYRIGLWTWR